MSTVLTSPFAIPSSFRPEGVLLSIPASAHTLDGFREWIQTLPEKTKTTFFRGEVLVDNIPLPSHPDGVVLVSIPTSAHTFDGFREWIPSLPEKTRVTFFQGEVLLDMSNEDVVYHTKVKGEIFSTVYQLAKQLDLGEVYQDGSLLSNVDANVSNNPDAVAALWATIESDQFRVVERNGKYPEMQGTPDWVLEVVSPSSVAKDTKFLKSAYHAARIPEYWLVDARRVDIDFAMLHWSESGYVPAPSRDGWQTSKVFGREFRLIRTTDRRGAMAYSLEIR
jgi:Uma2 family endonuclease